MASTNEFHEKGIKPFITASVVEISQAFNSSELLVTLDPKSYPGTKSEEFQTYRNDSLRILYNYYGSDASNKFQGRFTKRFTKIIKMSIRYFTARIWWVQNLCQ